MPTLYEIVHFHVHLFLCSVTLYFKNIKVKPQKSKLETCHETCSGIVKCLYETSQIVTATVID